MKDFLQGKPLRHPLHPALVHMPLALFFVSFLLDLASVLWPEFNGLVAGAFYCIGTGLVTALLAAVPGFVDYADIRDDHPAKKVATTHMVLNLLAVGIYGLNFGLRVSLLHEAQTPLLPLGLSAVGVVLLSVSGYLGGVLVYDDGIGVGRHRRRTRTPQNSIKVFSGSAEHFEDFVRVADCDALADRETLRVDLDGTVMTIAKIEGEFHAFQEFCTHRFGPLSEGSFEGHRVRCPWHGSCFEVASGKVVQSPATVDLKTFRVMVRDGKLFVAAAVEPNAARFIKPKERVHGRFSWPKLGRKLHAGKK